MPGIQFAGTFIVAGTVQASEGEDVWIGEQAAAGTAPTLSLPIENAKLTSFSDRFKVFGFIPVSVTEEVEFTGTVNVYA